MIERMKAVMAQLKRELTVYQRVLRDPRTPWLPRLILGAAVGYFLMPIDLIPDFIPVLGQLDDLLIVPGLVTLALKLLPEGLLEEHRAALAEEQMQVGA
jgi:uncharacterized membrane protein YkvA (DUF1232 family)